MDDSHDWDHLLQWRGTTYTLGELQTLMDRMDGLPDTPLRNDSPLRDHPSPSAFPFSASAGWTVPAPNWEIQEQSGEEFGVPGTSSTEYIFYPGISPLASPRLSSPAEMEHNYAALQSPAERRADLVDFDLQTAIGDRETDASTSRSSPELGSDVDIGSFQLNGSDLGSISSVASITSSYQDAPVSTELTLPENAGWLGRVFDTLSSQNTPQISQTSVGFHGSEQEDGPAAGRSASPEFPFRSSRFASAFIRRRPVIARTPSPPRRRVLAANTPPPARTPPSPSVSSRFSLSTGQTAQMSVLRSASSLRSIQRGAVRSNLLMPVFESRNGSVTLGAFPPTPAPPVVMEDLTPMAKKNISPQVRKVMGKLGMEFGEEARSSRALTPDPCSICFELPTVKNASLAYPCLHTFCDACISEWVKTKSSCPNCQAACTKILYNLRAELDYDSKDVPNRNTLIHPTSYDGDFLQFFFHMNHRRANLIGDRSATASLASSLSRAWMGQQASRGNPYLNRTPIREPFEVAAIFTRSFPDIPSPADQEVLLPHLFEVSRVSFRRRVYVERLSGMMNATSAQSAAFTAPSEIGPQVVGDPRFHPRVLPWLRREVLAVLVPEVSNAQREQLYQIVSDILRSQRSILKVNFLSQISGFVLASRADKFWEQMVQFLLSRLTMGVWDRFMLYFDHQGAAVGVSNTARPTPAPVTLVDINLFSDDEDTDNGPASTHSYPNQDPDDSDDSVQFLSIRRGRPPRRPAPLIVLSSDDDEAETIGVSTPQTVSAQTSPLLPSQTRRLTPPYFFPEESFLLTPSSPVAPLSPFWDHATTGSPSFYHNDVPMSTSSPHSPDYRSENWSEEAVGPGSPDYPPREHSWERQFVELPPVASSVVLPSLRTDAERTSRFSDSLQRNWTRRTRTPSRSRRHRRNRDEPMELQRRTETGHRRVRRRRSGSSRRDTEPSRRRPHRTERETRDRHRESRRLRTEKDDSRRRQTSVSRRT